MSAQPASVINLRLAAAIALALKAPVSFAADETLEPITVTATRRSESVQDVPYNISAITADQLLQSGVTDTYSLVRLIPGLSVVNEGPRVSGNRNNYTLRSLNVGASNNNDDNPSINQPTVSTYLGEVPVFFPLKLVDIDRVEVLRGPQGTLYGAGSVGGTIRFIPKKPQLGKTTFDASAELSSTQHGSKPSYSATMTANLPVAENMAFRATAGYEYLSGFIDALGLIGQTGTPRHPGDIVLANPSDVLGSGTVQAPVIKDSNDSKQTYARASLLIDASDMLRIGLTLNYQKVEANNRYEDNPYFGTGREYVTYKAFTDPQDAQITLADLDVEADLGFARLTSSTAYSNVKLDSVSDSSGFLRTNLPQYYFGNPRMYAPLTRQQKVNTFTQEVRLVSSEGKKVDWVAGVFYLHNKLDFFMNQVASGINAYTNAYFGTPSMVDFTDVLARGGTNQVFTDLAGFGEVTWHITPKWQITGGARAFKQKLSGTSGIPLPYASRTLEYFLYGTATNDFLLGGINPTNYKVNDHVVKLNSSYKFSDETMVYATYAEGFRAGGANQLPASDPFGNDNRPFLNYDPDTAKNYEIGVKGSLASRYTYTVSGFYVDWKNFQANLISPFGIVFIDNVPGAVSKGVELEVNGRVTDKLDVNVGYTYADATVSEAFLFNQSDPTTVIPKGNRLPGGAKNSLFGAVNYHIPLAGSELTLHADAAYKSEVLSNFRDLPQVPSMSYAVFPSFTVWNASVNWARDQLRVTLFGNNLSDERGTSSVNTASFYGDRDQGWGVIRPRTVGVRFEWLSK